MTPPPPSYPCPVCHDDVPVAPGTTLVVCLHCHNLLRLDTDAEFSGGLWRDRSSLHRALDPLPERSKPAA